jgi:hypothetical protein
LWRVSNETSVMAGGEAYPGAVMARRVSARRVLAVVAALAALPWPLFALSYAVDDGEWFWAAIAVVTVAVLCAAPFVAGWERFGCLAGVLWFALIVFGFATALAGGFVMWPAAFVFVIAAIPRRTTTWPLWLALALVGLVAAAVLAAVAATDS